MLMRPPRAETLALKAPEAHLPTQNEYCQAADSLARVESEFIDEDMFQDLGEGACVNFTGQPPDKGSELYDAKHEHHEVEVLPNGSSPMCESLCRSRNASCTGYFTTYPGGCVLTLHGFSPSAGDGSRGSRCFWRHRFLRNSTPLTEPIPKIIWSFWQTYPHYEVHAAFVRVCTDSWRKLNPTYEVHVLDHDSMWRWLAREDLPKQFHELMIQHQADAIRLALISKYGGIWLDASTLLVQPIEHIIGSDPSVRVFFQTTWYWDRAWERRVDRNVLAENWFFAAPPGDPLFMQTLSCIKEVYEHYDDKDLICKTGRFSKRQLNMLDFDSNCACRKPQYLSTHACMFAVIDEDISLTRWWHSGRVRHENPLTSQAGYPQELSFFTPQTAIEKAARRLFDESDEHYAKKLLNVPSGFVKFTGRLRNIALVNLKPKQLRCGNSTFNIMMDALGLRNRALC